MAVSSLLESRAQVPFNIIKNYDAELRFVCILKNLYFYIKICKLNILKKLKSHKKQTRHEKMNNKKMVQKEHRNSKWDKVSNRFFHSLILTNLNKLLNLFYAQYH